MNKFEMKCTRQAADMLEVDATELAHSLEIQVRAGLERISKDTSLAPTPSHPWYLENMIALEVLKDLKYPIDEDPEATEEIRGIIWRLMRDRDNYVSKTALKRFAKETENNMRIANPSKRWQILADMLSKYGYFKGLDIFDVLYSREHDAQKYPSGAIKRHGLTIAWNGCGVLRDGLSRIGIDHVWNKMYDASILLYWPETETLGKRRWQSIESAIDQLLDPTTKNHKDAMHDWWKWVDNHEIRIRPII